MGHKTIVFLVALYVMMAFGCGGGGGGAATPSDPNAVKSVALTTSKSIVLANETEFAALTAVVTLNSNAAAPNGTPVSFAITSGSASIFDAATSTTGGTATAKVRRAPIASPGLNQTVTITATAGGVTSAPVSIKFINKPDTAIVRLALDVPVTSLGALVFDLVSPTGATFTTAKGINEAATSNYVGFINPGVPSSTFTMLNVAGITMQANRQFLEFTYAIGAITELPVFQVSGDVTATTALGANIPLAAQNFVETQQFNTE